MHRHRHPYGADYQSQAHHSHHHSGHRPHSQQYNLDNDDNDRPLVSEQSSSMLPSTASSRSDMPAFPSYRKVSAPPPSLASDTTAVHHGHSPSAIQDSPSPSRSALHLQPRQQGRFYPLGPDAVIGRPKNTIHDYPFHEAKMPRGHYESGGSPSSGGEEGHSTAAAAFRNAPASSSFSYVLNSGLGPRKMSEGQQEIAGADSEMDPQEAVPPAATVNSKELVPPSSSTPLSSWRDPLSVPPSSNMAVSEHAPAPEPILRGGRRPVTDAASPDEISFGGANGTNDQSMKGLEDGRRGEEEQEQEEGAFVQGVKRRAVEGAFKPGTEPRYPNMNSMSSSSSAVAPHDAETLSHVLHLERPLVTSCATTPSSQEDGAWMAEREAQRQHQQQLQRQQNQYRMMAQDQEQQQHKRVWLPAQDRAAADRERIGQQHRLTTARFPEQEAQEHYHHQRHDDSYGALAGRRISQLSMDDKDLPTRLTHPAPARVAHGGASVSSSQGRPTHQQQQKQQHSYQHQHQHPYQGPVASLSAPDRSHPSHWDPSPQHPVSDVKSVASEMAHSSMSSPMSHPDRPVSSGGMPLASSSSSMSPFTSNSGARRRESGFGPIAFNEGHLPARYSISEGVYPPQSSSSLPQGYSHGGVPYQSRQQQSYPLQNPQSHPAMVDLSTYNHPSHPFYVQGAAQEGYPDMRHSTFPPHPLQQHPRQSHPQLHVQTHTPLRHDPFPNQDLSPSLPYHPSSSLPSTSSLGNKRRSVADQLFVPVKSREKRSGSLATASGLEAMATSPWAASTAPTGSPYSSTTLKQPPDFSHPNLPPSLSPPNRSISTTLSGASAAATAAMSTTPKSGKNGSAPTTPRSSKGSSGPKTFQCTGYPGCNMVFTRSEHLARHERKHTGEKPFKCIVANCPRTFSRYDNMIQHTQTHSDRSKREVDVHRMGSAHLTPGMIGAGRIGSGFGRGNSTPHKPYPHGGGMVPGNTSSPSVLATEHANGSQSQWGSYGSPAMHGYHSPGPPPTGPRPSHSKSLSSLRGAIDPSSPVFGMDTRETEEQGRRRVEIMHAPLPGYTGPGEPHVAGHHHAYPQSPYPPRQGSRSGSEEAYEARRQSNLGGGHPQDAPMSGAAVVAQRSVGDRPSNTNAAIGLGVSPLTPTAGSGQSQQTLPYVERLTPYEHEMLMEHRRSLANTPDLSSGSPSPWPGGTRGSNVFGTGQQQQHAHPQQPHHQQPLAQVHYLTEEEKERLKEHRRSTPDLLFEPSSKRSSLDSTEAATTTMQPLSSRDTKSGMLWYSQTTGTSMATANNPATPTTTSYLTESMASGSQESLGHPPFPPQPQPQPQQMQPRAQSIPLPHPLAVSRLSGHPSSSGGSVAGSMRTGSISLTSSSTSATPTMAASYISSSSGSVLPPIMGMHGTSGAIAFSKEPPSSPGSEFRQQTQELHLPPPLPVKGGIHPFSRADSFSRPYPHDSDNFCHEHGSTALSSSPQKMGALHDRAQTDRREWKKKAAVKDKRRANIYGSGSSRLQKQRSRRSSSMNLLLNSTGRHHNMSCLPSAVIEILSQDFAPVTRNHVESRMRRMDEKEYHRLKAIVSEKYADRLEAHPCFLNNLTALLCVVGEDDFAPSDEQTMQNQRQGGRDTTSMDIDSITYSRPTSLTFERIDLGALAHQQEFQSRTKGIQSLTITPQEEIPGFFALVAEKNSSDGSHGFVLGRFSLPPRAHCPKDILTKNFDLNEAVGEDSQWGLYSFQEFPDLRFVVLKSVIREYNKMKEAIQAGWSPFDDYARDSEEDVGMAVDTTASGVVKPKCRMALTLVKSADEDDNQVPKGMLAEFHRFDWTLMGHRHQVPFMQQPPMGLSRSTKVWTRFDRLMWHPTDSEILHRDYEMLAPPPTTTLKQKDDKAIMGEDDGEAVAARFVHVNSLEPAMMAFLWADMHQAYKECGTTYLQEEGELSDDKERSKEGAEDDEEYEYDVEYDEDDNEEDDESKAEGVETHMEEHGHDDDYSDSHTNEDDRLSMPESFKRWRTTRRSTTDSSSTSASRRDSILPSLLAMSAISASAPTETARAATVTTPMTTTILSGSTATASKAEPLTTNTLRTNSGASEISTVSTTSVTSATSQMSSASLQSSASGRRISIAELCSPMLTLGNSSNDSSQQ